MTIYYANCINLSKKAFNNSANYFLDRKFLVLIPHKNIPVQNPTFWRLKGSFKLSLKRSFKLTSLQIIFVIFFEYH